ERRLAARPVPGGVDHDGLALVATAAPDHRVREVLDRVDRLAVLPDRPPEPPSDDGPPHRLVGLHDLDARLHADRLEDPLDHLAHLARLLALVDRLHPSRVADGPPVARTD